MTPPATDDPAILVVDLDGELREHALRPGETIGRDAGCDHVLPHPTVSRRHATIDRDDGGWLLVDRAPRRLRDGDALRFGRLRAWFFERPVPDDWRPPRVEHDGRLVRCRCGKVGFAPAAVAGMSIDCRRCGRSIPIEPLPAAAALTCAACRERVDPAEMWSCEACGAAMHRSCRAELGGCATFGCENAPRVDADDSTPPDDLFNVPPARPTVSPLAAVGIGVVGLTLFGVPPLALAIVRRRERRTAAIGVVLFVAGAIASALLWPMLLAGAAR